MTDRTRLQMREAGMSFLPGGGWGQPSYRMRGSEIQEDLERAAPPLWREQPAEVVPTSGQEASCISYFGDVACRRRAGDIVYLSWPGKALDFPNRSRWKRLGGRVIGAPCRGCSCSRPGVRPAVRWWLSSHTYLWSWKGHNHYCLIWVETELTVTNNHNFGSNKRWTSWVKDDHF